MRIPLNDSDLMNFILHYPSKLGGGDMANKKCSEEGWALCQHIVMRDVRIRTKKVLEVVLRLKMHTFSFEPLRIDLNMYVYREGQQPLYFSYSLFPRVKRGLGTDGRGGGKEVETPLFFAL